MVKKCPMCNKPLDSLIPYKCKRCGLYFCHQHRLPENHSCSGLSHEGNIKDWINEEQKFKDQPEEKQSTLKKVFGIGEKKDDESMSVKPLVSGAFAPPPLSILVWNIQP